MKYSFLVIIATLLFFSSCKIKKETKPDANCESCEDAIIRFFGEPASDGCGWVLEVSNTIYMPKNLLPEFYTDSLKIRTKYKVLERVNCGLLEDAYPSIFIEEILIKHY